MDAIDIIGLILYYGVIATIFFGFGVLVFSWLRHKTRLQRIRHLAILAGTLVLFYALYSSWHDLPESATIFIFCGLIILAILLFFRIFLLPLLKKERKIGLSDMYVFIVLTLLLFAVFTVFYSMSNSNPLVS